MMNSLVSGGRGRYRPNGLTGRGHSDEDILSLSSAPRLSISPGSCGASPMIRHGIFCGECAGYCVSKIEVSGSEVIYKARYSGPSRESPPPERTRRASITADAWNQLLSSVQESEFLKLNDRY